MIIAEDIKSLEHMWGSMMWPRRRVWSRGSLFLNFDPFTGKLSVKSDGTNGIISELSPTCQVFERFCEDLSLP